uniref:Uncharacterized protein n=1 Tax=Caenorhabditis japonica TaxID=281687 RepID=A0A8R1I862_CAEJA
MSDVTATSTGSAPPALRLTLSLSFSLFLSLSLYLSIARSTLCSSASSSPSCVSQHATLSPLSACFSPSRNFSQCLVAAPATQNGVVAHDSAPKRSCLE